MEWTDQGIVLHASAFGESAGILELFTRGHGRHKGVLHGVRSRPNIAASQPGNLWQAKWRARIEDQLGTWTVEDVTSYAPRLMQQTGSLAGMLALLSLLRLLPERDPHAGLFDSAVVVLDHLEDRALAPRLLVAFELAFLAESGFGLDLSRCAATDTTEDLVYVSPKSGRAVSRSAGAPYHDKLLALPAFLAPGGQAAEVRATDLEAAFQLTGFFLEDRVLAPRGMAMPQPRQTAVHYFTKTRPPG